MTLSKILTTFLKNKLTVRLNHSIDNYNPVHEVCRFLINNYVVLSDNFDDMINSNDVQFRQKSEVLFQFRTASSCDDQIHHSDESC